MSQSSRELLLRFVSYAQASCQGVKDDTSISFTSSEGRSFLAALQAFNEDRSVEDNTPFFFMPSSVLEPSVPEQLINKILLRAASRGLEQHFVKLQLAHGPVLHCSHQAYAFAKEQASANDLRLANLGANGICLKWFSCIGLHGATARRIAMAANEIKTLLAYSAI